MDCFAYEHYRLDLAGVTTISRVNTLELNFPLLETQSASHDHPVAIQYFFRNPSHTHNYLLPHQ